MHSAIRVGTLCWQTSLGGRKHWHFNRLVTATNCIDKLRGTPCKAVALTLSATYLLVEAQPSPISDIFRYPSCAASFRFVLLRLHSRAYLCHTFTKSVHKCEKGVLCNRVNDSWKRKHWVAAFFRTSVVAIIYFCNPSCLWLGMHITHAEKTCTGQMPVWTSSRRHAFIGWVPLWTAPMVIKEHTILDFLTNSHRKFPFQKTRTVCMWPHTCTITESLGRGPALL